MVQSLVNFGNYSMCSWKCIQFLLNVFLSCWIIYILKLLSSDLHRSLRLILLIRLFISFISLLNSFGLFWNSNFINYWEKCFKISHYDRGYVCNSIYFCLFLLSLFWNCMISAYKQNCYVFLVHWSFFPCELTYYLLMLWLKLITARYSFGYVCMAYFLTFFYLQHSYTFMSIIYLDYNVYF